MSISIHKRPNWNPWLSRFCFTFSAPLFAFIVLAAVHATAPNSPTGDVLLQRGPDRTIDLSDFSGQTYLQAMQASGTGIFDKTDADDAAAVTIASAAPTSEEVIKFDSKVSSQVFGMFKNGQTDFTSVISNIQGKSFSPRTIRDGIKPFISKSNLKPGANSTIAVDATADMALLASGSGTLVKIDSSNYFYNVAYQKPVVKSGRTYAVATGRALLDPSDRDYLTELAAYMMPASTPDPSAFYAAILKVLVSCNSSDYATLSSPGPVVATDFLAIYTAELDRHIMVNLVPTTHPWEIDLAEVTFLNAYGAPSGMVMKSGALIPGTAAAYYAVGTSGSGIGETRKDFVKLATRITSFESSSGHHPELVNAIVTLTPIQDAKILSAVKGDVFRRYLVYLNRPEFQSGAQTHSTDLLNAMGALLKQISADNVQITSYIHSHP